MISVVLYGRNDSYGYNLHKRAALSLNCIAEVLTDPSDEILFVDYNTPDDYPTFPEAIQDTLTRRAQSLLRILRVRPRIHERFRSATALLALEPIARNVAVRRSEPSNRWILSTNTDMILVPHRGLSLTDVASKLPAGFYHAPRIELPETLWESLDRKAAASIIETIKQWGWTLHLNEIVLGSKIIRYDGPGDFQLLLRDDLIENNGFDERMLLGWHVDSNIAKRMFLKYDEVGDLGTEIFGYHCDHTRQVTPAHSHDRVQNDWRQFVDNVNQIDIPEQATTWGCPDDLIEEVRLIDDSAKVYVQTLQQAIGAPLAVPKTVEYTGESYNKTDYDPPHLMPFLADMFASMSRDSHVAWYGLRTETIRLFAIIWEKLGFTGKILIDQEFEYKLQLASAATILVPRKFITTEAVAFIFDFGGLPPQANNTKVSEDADLTLRQSLLRVASDERARLASGLTSRRIVTINTINNEYESLVCGLVAAAATPYGTRMRHGFVLPQKPDRLELAKVELNRLTSEVSALRHELNERTSMLEAQLFALRSSTSWRLTQPLRRLAGTGSLRTRRNLRRAVKATWWAITPWRIPTRIRLIRERNVASQAVCPLQKPSTRPIDLVQDKECPASRTEHERDQPNNPRLT